jgi:hypothetical protein
MHYRQFAVSFVVMLCLTRNDNDRCFLAVKYGSDAMMKTNSSRGKNVSGGSIILTASGTLVHPIRITTMFLIKHHSGRAAVRGRDHRLWVPLLPILEML